MDYCHRGHSLTGPRDRLPSGQCRECDRINQATYHARRRTAMDLLRAYEARGLGISDIPKPERLRVALHVLDAVTPEQLDHIARMDPDGMRRALENLQKFAGADNQA